RNGAAFFLCIHEVGSRYPCDKIRWYETGSTAAFFRIWCIDIVPRTRTINLEGRAASRYVRTKQRAGNVPVLPGRFTPEACSPWFGRGRKGVGLFISDVWKCREYF